MGVDKRLPIVVGTVYIRESGSHGEYTKIDCARAVQTTVNTSEKTATITCDKGVEAVLEQPTSKMTFTVIRTKNPDLFGNLFGLSVTARTSGSQTITNLLKKFNLNKIELDERSNDNAGVTGIVVKSLPTGGTTYTITTDYTVSVVDNRTIITRVPGGTIPQDGTVYISGTIIQNAAKSVSVDMVQRVKKMFEVKIEGQAENSLAVNEYITVSGDPCTLDSEYLLEFINAIKAGDVTGASLTFNIQEGGKWKMVDEII